MSARVAGGTDGPDQGDPAAWTAGDDAMLWEGTRVELLYRHDEPGMWWVQRSDGHAYVAHERWLRAPGAVAAAPPGNENDDATEAVLDSVGAVLLTDAPLSVRASAQRVAVLIEVDGWRLVPPAPPAGHEDEAAVERAAQAYAAFNYAVWDALDEVTQDQYRDETRAVLAAARGPRTPDPGAGA